MSNIYLVGFMGTGKSAVGKKLAQKLDRTFVDTDELISQVTGLSIKDIFAQYGEEFFRSRETEVLQQVSRQRGIVVATGGGIVLRKENIEIMKATGHLCCLQARPEDIFLRIKTDTERPLLQVEDPLKRIGELLESRKGAYEQADFTVDTTGLTITGVANKIIKSMKKKV